MMAGRAVVFFAVMLGMLVAALNLTVVGTALPRIAADLQGLKHFPWVFTAYFVTAASTMPIFGKLSDMYGRKQFLMGGIAVLVGGAVLAGTSQNIFQLAAYRGIQGVGAGAIIPVSMAIVGDLFPPSEQGKWRAYNQGVFTITSILGPLVGGLATDHLSWRWVFYMNVPVGLIALLVIGFVMPSFRMTQQRHTVDYLGAAVLLLAIAPLLVGFSLVGQQYSWGSVWVIGIFIFSVWMLLMFVFIELRANEPILPLNMLRNSVFVIVLLTFFLVGLGLFGSLIYLPLFVQAVSGQTATNSGLILMPMAVASFLAGVVGGQLLSRWGRYRILALFGTGASALGMFLLSRMGVDTASGAVTFNMIVLGLGVGVVFPLLTIVAQNAVPQRMLGVAVSSCAFVRNLGGTMGVAAMGTVVGSRFIQTFQSALPERASAVMEDAGNDILYTPQALLDPDTVNNLQISFMDAGEANLVGPVLEVMRGSLAGALNDAFLFGAIALSVAFIACLFLKEVPLRISNETDMDMTANVHRT